MREMGKIFRISPRKSARRIQPLRVELSFVSFILDGDCRKPFFTTMRKKELTSPFAVAMKSSFVNVCWMFHIAAVMEKNYSITVFLAVNAKNKFAISASMRNNAAIVMISFLEATVHRVAVRLACVHHKAVKTV